MDDESVYCSMNMCMKGKGKGGKTKKRQKTKPASSSVPKTISKKRMKDKSNSNKEIGRPAGTHFVSTFLFSLAEAGVRLDLTHSPSLYY